MCRMLVRLFDIQDGKPIPSEHSYTLGFLKDIREHFPKEQSIEIYQYLFYMTHPDPDQNACFNLSQTEKEEFILRELRPTFYVDDMKIQYALERCRELYETPTKRVYDAMAGMMDKIATYLQNNDIQDGRDGNGDYIVKLMEKYPAMNRAFKEAYKDMKEEFGSRGRGGREMAYDDDED